ncbi:DUF2779 domain-containing protein [Patescibacteria group bacterium]|nr:DUF2779 domain-containing protein [Patescibacteria group bacterium]
MLTKTDYKNYLECPMWLWLAKYRPELLPEITLDLQRRFDTGNQVDALAKELFPGGIEIEGYNKEGWENTQKAIKSGATILFQPTVIAGELSCRADILTKNKDGSWDINEVKMATSAKSEYVYDVGFQKICFERAGIRIHKTNIIHVDNTYVRHGEIEPRKLLALEDITREADKYLPETEEGIKEALRVIRIKDEPSLELINGCSNPKNCEYLECYCKGIKGVQSVAKNIQPKHLLALLNRNLVNYKKIPEEVLESIGYKPEESYTKIDAPAIKKEFEKLIYPLHFFDYETFGSAIPPFDGTRPYQQIPFQYSLHVKDDPISPIRHYEFLARRFEDPVPELLTQLEREIGPKGSVIVWHATFESGRNKEMADMEPDFTDFLGDVNDRIFDLLLIFKHKNQMYIKSEFNKLASLKIVLPVLCPELSYENLAIQGGGDASSSWPVLTDEKTPVKEKEQLAKNMLAYCKRDTEAMVGIMDKVLKDIK